MAKKTAKKASSAKTASAKKKAAAGKQPKKQAQKIEQRDKCFVMMPFSDPFDIYYERIYKSAIEGAGLQPIRADDLFRPSVIVSDLWDMVQESKILLAELTTKNANVFYELGLAHAIGKPVVLVSETLGDVPFDLQQLRVILYDKNDPNWGDKLASDVSNAIKETIEAPIAAVPSTFRKKVESQGPEQNALESRLEDLENQVRQVRRDQLNKRRLSPSRRPSMFNKATTELGDVSGPNEFELWVRRWYQMGVTMEELQMLVGGQNHVPETEAERIQEILATSE